MRFPVATCAGELLLSQVPFTAALLAIRGKGESCSPDMHKTSCLCPARVCRQTRVSMSCMSKDPLIWVTQHGGCCRHVCSSYAP